MSAPAKTLLEHLTAPGAGEAYDLSKGQLVRLREAFRLKFSSRKSDKRRADEIAAEIYREILELYANDNARLSALEALHGGRLEILNDQGARRATSRDGLASLADAGHITPEQCKAGLAYRWGYEALGKDLQSQLNAPSGGGGVPGSGALERKFRQGQALAYFVDLERYVERQTPKRKGFSSAKALMVLRLIAGEGRAISSIAAGGKQQARLRDHLALALDLAAAFQARGR